MVAIIKKGLSPKKIREVFREIKKDKKVFKASKYCGVIKVKEDALIIQKKTRNEWD